MHQAVILRPREQGEALASYLTRQGIPAYVLPMLEIAPLSLSETAWEAAAIAISQATLLFVASQHAIHYAPSSLLKLLSQQKNMRIMTMGKTTTEIAEKQGLVVDFTAPPGTTSEILLTHSFLQFKAIQNKTVILLAGNNGRQLIADELATRGANIHWIKVYEQKVPSLDLHGIFTAWKKQHIPYCFIATSSNALHNLYQTTPLIHRAWLLSHPCIVVSQRIANDAYHLGFRHIVIAQGAENEAIARVLRTL